MVSDESNTSKRRPEISRRDFLRGTTAGTAAVVGGVGVTMLAAPVGAASSNPWQLTFEDQFDQGRLDTSKWGIGYGWGRTSDGKREQVRDQDVAVDAQNDELVLTIDRDGSGWYSGAVNTKNKHAQKYGWWEASLKPPSGATGLLPAFWSKPNSEAWPPEIDFVEWVGDNHQAVHNVHYTDSNGEKSNWEGKSQGGSSLTNDFNVYGCHWEPDKVSWYIGTEKVAQTSDGIGNSEGQLNSAGPYYTMLSTHIWDQSWLGGSPEQLSGWPFEFRCNWVRCWSRSDY